MIRNASLHAFSAWKTCTFQILNASMLLVKYHVVFGKPRDFDSQVCLLWLPAAMKENERRIMFSTLK